MNRWILASTLIVAIGSCPTLPAQGPTHHALLRVEGDWIRTDTGKSLNRRFHFANEAVSYGLTYDIAVSDDLPANRCSAPSWAWKIGHVPLGMNAPIQANWYYQAFSAIHVDGVSLHDIPATFRAVRTSGADVMAEGTWQTPKGPVYLRLVLRAGDDKLLMQLALPPESEAQRLELKLMAYPQGFPEPRGRRAATVAADHTATARIDLAELQQPWILLYDELYDQHNRGGGPCGLVFVPEELESAVTSLGAYAVPTTLKAKPGGRKITIGLWDFTPNREVAGVRQYLRKAGAVVAQDMARVAAADWNVGLPAAQLPEDYVAKLAAGAETRRRPTDYDRMSRQVVTPHTAWAVPLAGGPVRTLVIGPRWHQRETVELAQRLDMEYATVSFSSAEALIDPQELYLYGSYELYGNVRKNETDILFELSRSLAAERDCLVLTGFRRDVLPPGTRRDILAKVRAGTGLVLFGHARELLTEFGDALKPTQWQPEVVPLETLPGVRELLAADRPVWNAYSYGDGRVLVFHYNTGNRGVRLAMTPGLSHEDPDVLGYYDYYHSLVAAGVLWASRRQPAVRIRFAGGTDEILVDAAESLAGVSLEVMIHDPQRGIRVRKRVESTFDLPPGESKHTLPPFGPTTGPRFVSVWLKRGGQVLGWCTGHADLGKGRPHIEAVDLSGVTLEPGAPVAGIVRLSALPAGAELEIQLVDSLGRLLAERKVEPEQTTVPFELPLSQPITILHEIRVRLRIADRVLDQRLAHVTTGRRRVDDFHFLVWSGGQNHAIRHSINDVLAAGGVDWIDNTGLTGGDALKADVYCRNAARHNLASVPYITRIASMQETGRERRPCLHDPAHLESWTKGLEERARGCRPFGPPAYTLGDENFLVRNRLDVCIAPHTLNAFRESLQREYDLLEQLNNAWQTEYATWGEIVPSTFDEVKLSPAHWPRWADHRRFMDRTLTLVHATGRDAIRRGDPDARVGFDGVFSLDSWHGYDFYGLCRACDLVQVYAQRHHQIEYLRCWHLPDAVRGAWYNHIGNRDETSAKRLAWHLLFHGLNGSWYWTSYNTGPALLYPDLRPTPQFEWMQESIGEIKRGIGKLLLQARREHDGIAIHYSQPSVHAGTLMDRRHALAQWGFARLVEDMGLQYDMLSGDQIQQGRLAGYRVLLMPAAAAVSRTEVDAIHQFVQQGGLVVADTVPALLDEHCRLLPTGQLDDLFGVRRSGLPQRGSETIRLTRNDQPQELPLTVYDMGVRSAGADAWGVAGDVPAVLVHGSGKGHTVLLNTAGEAYEQLHFARTGRPVATLMERLFGLAGIRPQVSVTAGDEPVDACEIVRFSDGEIQYIALVRDNHVAGLPTEDVTVRLPKKFHVYDVRAKQSLGRTDRISARFVPGEPKVYALLPYAVEAISLAPVAGEATPGQPLALSVALDLGGQDPAGHHCLHVEVLRPDGQTVRHYAQNVLTRSLTADVSVPLARNDPEGTWQIRVTDVASGRSALISVEKSPEKH